jgi:hypothetical protein
LAGKAGNGLCVGSRGARGVVKKKKQPEIARLAHEGLLRSIFPTSRIFLSAAGKQAYGQPSPIRRALRAGGIPRGA